MPRKKIEDIEDITLIRARGPGGEAHVRFSEVAPWDAYFIGVGEAGSYYRRRLRKEVKKLLDSRGLRIQDLSKLTHFSNITISKFLNSRLRMSRDFLVMLKKVFGDEFDLNKWLIYYNFLPSDLILLMRVKTEEFIEEIRNLLNKYNFNGRGLDPMEKRHESVNDSLKELIRKDALRKYRKRRTSAKEDKPKIVFTETAEKIEKEVVSDRFFLD